MLYNIPILFKSTKATAQSSANNDFLNILITVFILLIAIILYCICIYNKLISLKNQVKKAYSQIEVQLKRRHDLIPNLIETVKGYMQHEKETLEKVIKARNLACNISSDAKIQSQNENILSSNLKSLFALSEKYPDLKANQNFLSLQEELTSTENKIAFARQFYNDSIMQYNTQKEVFPNNVIADKFNFQSFSMFEIEDVKEKEVIKVNF